MNEISTKDVRAAALRLILCALFVAAGARQAAAGVGMGLVPGLEKAEHVVIGQVVKIEETDVQKDGEGRVVTRWGRATVAVREVLKGTPAKTVEFTAPTYDDKNPMRQMVLQVVRVGDSGIWLVNYFDHKHSSPAESWLPWERLPVEDKPDIQRILNALAEKRWSEPINGLRAWAVPLVSSDPYVYGIIFAVNNATDVDVFLPIPTRPRVTRADVPFSDLFWMTVKDNNGKTLDFSLDGGYPHSKPVECGKLPPGKTTYFCLGPAWRSETKLSPGRYSIVVTYRNARNDGKNTGMRWTDQEWEKPVIGSPQTATTQIRPWTGELKAPSAEIVIPPENQSNFPRPTTGGPPLAPPWPGPPENQSNFPRPTTTPRQ